ncbi:PID-CTERM protein-sorting domain-containing protein [Botryobacter ruber]|uniref:PID-CTERM protein-sorting domain-containing protein n=1 Tax=Botryobacter ruber TaxID=2171629 RepID=UPI0013E377C0|nr:hypothetical protein [Botryobacter ruber]
MKKIKILILRPVLVVGLLLAFSATGALAQGGRPGNLGPSRAGRTGVPIDGGAGLLLAAGAAYGLKKVHEMRKGKKQEPEA